NKVPALIPIEILAGWWKDVAKDATASRTRTPRYENICSLPPNLTTSKDFNINRMETLS
ncbi:hypothetical protein L195_g059377, partial [Trifolium pratense]